jgi:methylglutaconyl-CoA hydratase
MSEVDSKSNANPILIDYNESTMVMTVSLNRPQRSNALSIDMISQLLELVRGVTTTFESIVFNNQANSTSYPLVRVFVVTAVGKVFCSGMDLKAAASSSPTGANTTESMVALLDAIRALPMPSVLLLNGPALGGGTVFAFLMDFVFAIRDVYLQMSEVKIGMLPAMISCFIVPRIGTAQAGAMMLSGRRYHVDEWHVACGGGIALVSSEAGDVEQLRAIATRFIHEHLLTSSSFSSAHMKRLIAHVATHEHADNCRVARQAFETVFASEDMQYGLQCFAKKTKPNWTNQIKSKL